ncbi:Probable peptidoglycan glycosyltransferase FtsW [Geodia barretti]|uniref:peptidoglycan glycosyltransferase n=1 Tax=Geodia barretti TaxID=519541 RepID=A0AA35SPV3_GEOBA|nr:Probable peptidoglycan glycosyltransferase FtsW [Geodia barretti]
MGRSSQWWPASRVNSEVLKRLSIPLLALSAVLMTLTLIPGISTPIQGADAGCWWPGSRMNRRRLVKFTLVLYLASMLSRKYEGQTDAVNTLLPPVIVWRPSRSLISRFQHSCFTSALLMLVTGIIFFVARVQFRYFVALASVGLPLAVIMIFTRVHRVERVISFFNPEADPTGSGYQMLAARQALTSGGLTGLGLGQGVRKLVEVPEIHSDFVFAVVGEETGLIGVVIVLLFRGVASRAIDP